MSERAAPRAIGPLERVLILRTWDGFEELSQGALSAIAEHAQERFFPRGSVIQREGEPVSALEFVVEGEVQTTRHGHPFRRFGPRTASGGMFALGRDPQGVGAVALVDTLALELATDDFFDLLEDHFEVLVGVLRRMARLSIRLRHGLGEGAGFGPPGALPPPPDRALDLVERIFCLRRALTFAQTRIEPLATLARATTEVRIAAGTTLWRKGDRSDRSLILVAGGVECRADGGRQRFLFGPGDTLGGLDLMAGQGRWYDAETTASTVALQVDAEAFLDVMEDSVDMAMDFAAVVARGVIGLVEMQSGHG